MYVMSCLFMTRAACHAVVEAISHGHEAEGRMGRDVPAIIVSQYDRRRYRDKVRRCLDVFARMLQDARFKEAPQQVGLEAEFYLVDGAGDACERGA